MTSRAAPDAAGALRAPAVAAVAGLVLGALTSFTQARLPGALASPANSAGRGA